MNTLFKQSSKKQLINSFLLYDHSIPVRLIPTLIIGLGGSGMRVLQYLRRMFFNHYGQDRIPIVDYLWIDTDINDVSDTSSEYATPLPMQPSDYINCSINEEAFIEAVDNIPGSYAHIKDWFPEKELGAIVKNSGILNGAKQIRALGRFSFVYHHDKIREMVTYKLKNIDNDQHQTIDLFKQRGKIEPLIDGNDKQIFVVSSVSGGTGSGCFLDMGFMLKSILSDEKIHAKQTGIFFLPTVFDNLANIDRERSYANGYAALKELDYFMSTISGDRHTGKYTVEWKRGEREQLQPPVYNNVFLLENQTSHKGRKIEISDAYRMAAEYLFIDFDESIFSSKLRSIHSNTDIALATHTVIIGNNGYPVQSFQNVYNTFGISRINLSVDAMRRQLIALVTGDFYSRLFGIDEPPAEQSKYTDDNYLNSPVARVAALVSEGGPLFSELSNQWMNTVTVDDTSSILHAKIKTIQNNFAPLVDKTDLFSAVLKDINAENSTILQCLRETMETSGETGVFKNRICALQETVYATIMSDFFGDLASRVNQSYRIPLGTLEHALQYIDNSLTALLNEPDATVTGEHVAPADMDTRLSFDTGMSEFIATLKRDAEELPGFPPRFREIAITYAETRRIAFENDVSLQLSRCVRDRIKEKAGEIRAYIATCEVTISRMISRSVYQKVKEDITRYISGISQFRDVVHARTDAMKQAIDGLRSTSTISRNLEVSMKWDDNKLHGIIGGLFNKPYAEFIRETVAYGIETGFSSRHDFIRRLFDVFTENKSSMEDFCNDLTIAVDNERLQRIHHYDPVRKDRRYSLFQLLNESMDSDEEYHRRVRQCIELAEPYLRFTPDTSRLVEDKKSIAFVGTNDADHRYRTMIQQLGGESWFDFQTGHLHEHDIVFYREEIGFPICSVAALQTMKRCYNAMIRRNKSNRRILHLVQKDIVLPDIMKSTTVQSEMNHTTFRFLLIGLIGDPDHLRFNKSTRQLELLINNNDPSEQQVVTLGSTLQQAAQQVPEHLVAYLENRYGLSGELFTCYRTSGDTTFPDDVFYICALFKDILATIEHTGTKGGNATAYPILPLINDILHDFKSIIVPNTTSADASANDTGEDNPGTGRAKSGSDTTYIDEEIEYMRQSISSFSNTTGYFDKQLGYEIRSIAGFIHDFERI